MRTSLNEPPDTAIASFRQQASIFSLLNLFVIGALLLVHVLLAPYWGRLSPPLLVALGLGFLFHAVIFMWIQARPATITRSLVVSLTVSSIAVNSILTFVAAATNHDYSQYFALMIIPILEAAFRFSLFATTIVVAVADGLNFYWVWEYYRIHPSQQFNEYIEAGTVSMIYTTRWGDRVVAGESAQTKRTPPGTQCGGTRENQETPSGGGKTCRRGPVVQCHRS